MKDKCPICKGILWVCENHPDKPWGDAGEDIEGACSCGAGAPCECNPKANHIPGSFIIEDFTINERAKWN